MPACAAWSAADAASFAVWAYQPHRVGQRHRRSASLPAFGASLRACPSTGQLPAWGYRTSANQAGPSAPLSAASCGYAPRQSTATGSGEPSLLFLPAVSWCGDRELQPGRLLRSASAAAWCREPWTSRWQVRSATLIWRRFGGYAFAAKEQLRRPKQPTSPRLLPPPPPHLCLRARPNRVQLGSAPVRRCSCQRW